MGASHFEALYTLLGIHRMRYYERQYTEKEVETETFFALRGGSSKCFVECAPGPFNCSTALVFQAEDI